MSYTIQELCDEIGELKQALAAKDRELIRLQNDYAEKWAAQDKRISGLIETNNKLKAAYNTLMELAIKFAQELVDIAKMEGEFHPWAEAFLKEQNPQ